MKKILDIVVVLALILFMWWSVQHAHADSVFPSRPKFQDVGIRSSTVNQILPAGESGWLRAVTSISVGDPTNVATTAQPGNQLYLTTFTNGGTTFAINSFPTDPLFASGAINFNAKNDAGSVVPYVFTAYGVENKVAGAERAFETEFVYSAGVPLQAWGFDPQSAFSFVTDGTIRQRGNVGTSNDFVSPTTFDSTVGITGTLTGATANLGTVTSSNSFTVSAGSTNALPLDVEGTVTTGLTGRLKNNSANVAAFAKYQIYNINNHGVEITANNAATDGSSYNCSTATCTFTDNTNQFLLHTNSTRATVVGDTGGVTNVQGTSVQINGSTLVTTSSFTATVTGMTAGTTGTVFYRIVGNVAYLYTQTSISGTSNSTVLTLTGLPAAIQPAHEHVILSYFTDNGTLKMGLWDVTNSGTVTMSVCATTISCSASGFTASGSKGLQLAFTVSYPLD